MVDAVVVVLAVGLSVLERQFVVVVLLGFDLLRPFLVVVVVVSAAFCTRSVTYSFA